MGRVEWIPTLLVGVNILAAALMAAFAGAFAKRFGLHALWGVIVPFYPGFVLTFSRDLAEIVAAAFAMGAIWAAASRRNIAAALLLTCAVLTRETTLLLAVWRWPPCGSSIGSCAANAGSAWWLSRFR
jgi:hypothetical protein